MGPPQAKSSKGLCPCPYLGHSKLAVVVFHFRSIVRRDDRIGCLPVGPAMCSIIRSLSCTCKILSCVLVFLVSL